MISIHCIHYDLLSLLDTLYAFKLLYIFDALNIYELLLTFDTLLRCDLLDDINTLSYFVTFKNTRFTTKL